MYIRLFFYCRIIVTMISIISSQKNVDDAINKVKLSCIFKYHDHGFLKRVYVAQQTIPDKSGGIFRVTKLMLTSMKDVCKENNCTKTEDVLQQKIHDLDINSVEDPLVSTMVMAYHISLKIDVIAASLEQQAEQWVAYIYPYGDANTFILESSHLQKRYDCTRSPIDIVVIYDISNYFPEYKPTFIEESRMLFSHNVPNVRYAYITSGQNVKLQINFDTKRYEYEDIIKSVDFQNLERKSLIEAVNIIWESIYYQFKEPNVQRYIIIISSSTLMNKVELLKILRDKLVCTGAELFVESLQKHEKDYRELSSVPYCTHYGLYREQSNYQHIIGSILSTHCSQ